MPVVGAVTPAIPVPPGGFPGAILSKNSADTGDFRWQGVAAGRSSGIGGAGMYPSGSWHSNQTTPVVGNVNALSIVTGTSYYIPLWLPWPVSINALATRYGNSSAGQTLYLWISAMDPVTLAPSSVLSPTISSPFSGGNPLTIPFPGPTQIPAGWSFIGAGQYDTAAGFDPRLYGAGASGQTGAAGVYRFPAGSVITTGTSFTSQNSVYYNANGYLPITNPPATLSPQNVPTIWFRIA